MLNMFANQSLRSLELALESVEERLEQAADDGDVLLFIILSNQADNIKAEIEARSL